MPRRAHRSLLLLACTLMLHAGAAAAEERAGALLDDPFLGAGGLPCLERVALPAAVARPRMRAFIDLETMAAMLADPVEAARLADAALTPGAAAVLIACVTDPTLWDRWLRQLADPDTVTRAATRVLQPEVWLRWAQAPTNEEFCAITARVASPARMLAIAFDLARAGWSTMPAFSPPVATPPATTTP